MHADDATNSPENNGSSAPAGKFMGFGALLRQWRRNAGVTQVRAAKALAMSERTYRKIERGASPPRITKSQCDALAELFALDRTERHALHLHGVGSSVHRSERQLPVPADIRLLLTRQMPNPAYICDQHWNIIAYNAAMAQWWPWVTEDNANLFRWSLLTSEARSQYHDWPGRARAAVRMLKFALATSEYDPDLDNLVGQVLRDSEVREIWASDEELDGFIDGHHFRMTVPALDWEPVNLISHELHPASLPAWKFVVVTWTEASREEPPIDVTGRSGVCESPLLDDLSDPCPTGTLHEGQSACSSTLTRSDLPQDPSRALAKVDELAEHLHGRMAGLQELRETVCAEIDPSAD
ncbi:helix-turn-helix transcriptional regulator [Streptomyces sp. P38-E01]|uniref:Helix-turn-helix transcriptional regulator n=1 Tax=Streptomyces tardus TaxID=2780544 RepID=A0A949JF39_9ACTN|nr:helix-turn-helix transcriptional regulator [Streptomyces tardus]MBU7598928.1 helix-turn-helix transcriptional regulator [Streptomyces tardus]